jgi:hypothetical protein
MIDDLPSDLAITVDGQRVHSISALRAQVEAFNGTRSSLDGIPPALDPYRLAWQEVERFVNAVVRDGLHRALAGAVLELTRPELKLFALDGLGVHGFTGRFTLRPTADGVVVEPAFERRDVEADLFATEDLVAEQLHRTAAAEAALATVTSADPDYPPRWKALLSARRAQVVGWILLGIAVRTAQAFLVAEAARGESHAVVAMRAGAADATALATRVAALDQAIVNGPRVGRLPPTTASAAPGGGPGAAPGGGPGAAPGRPGRAS